MFDAGRLADMQAQADPAMQDAMRASVAQRTAPTINSPQSLQAALSSLADGLAAQRTANVQKTGRIGAETAAGVDPARMAANAPMLIKASMVDGNPEVGVLPTGQVAGVVEYADGAIVGTALVRALRDGGLDALATTTRALADGTPSARFDTGN